MSSCSQPSKPTLTKMAYCKIEFIRCITIILAFIVQFDLVTSKIISGELNSREHWAFMTRFCFKDSYGQMQYRFEYPQENAVQNLLLYFDSQWPKVYPKPEMQCKDKEDKLYKGNNQVINLTLSYIWSGCKVERKDNVNTLVCLGDRRFLSRRARWWYIALSNCEPSSKGLHLKYFLNLTNGDTFWTMHFSADEREIIKTDIFFLIMFVVLCIITINTSYRLVTRRLFHYTFKLFIWSVVLETISLITYIAYYVDYGKTGESKYSIQVIARVFHYVAHIVFLLLLILLAKGWTVTRGRISSTGQIKLSAFCTLYAVCFAVLFIYEASVFDPGQVLYIYESPAGIGICVLRVIAWLWFCYGTFFTLKHYPSKSVFYYPFWFFYTAWFLAGPVIVVISTFLIAAWAREQIVNGIEWTVSWLAHLFFLIITRPNQANKNFPFHIRTNQIGIINTPAPTTTQTTTPSSYPSYSPAYPPLPAYSENANTFTDIAAMFTAKGATSSSPQGLYRNGVSNTNSTPTTSNGSYPMMPISLVPRESPA